MCFVGGRYKEAIKISINYHSKIIFKLFIKNCFEPCLVWLAGLERRSINPRGLRLASQSGRVPGFQVPFPGRGRTRGSLSVFLFHIAGSLSVSSAFPLSNP